MKPYHLRFHIHPVVLLLSVVAALRLASPTCAHGATMTASIADNATGVAVNLPMVFTFSKAMDTGGTSATFLNNATSGVVDVTEAWSAGDTVLTYTPTANNWPDQTQIQWLLAGTDVDGTPSPPPGFAIGLFTTGTGGGTTDTNPPVLFSSTPTNNAAGVPLNRLIRFTFNEAMQTGHSILWSANLTDAKFAYSWSADAKTLTCKYSESLPTNAIITWKLNPSGPPALFKDATGNALAADIYAGSFETSNTNSLCDEGQESDPRGSFSMSWQVTYVQTGNGTPNEDTNSLPGFFAFLNSPTTNPVTTAVVEIPGGSSLELSNFFGSTFFNADEYASQAQLDASRPPGNYTLHVNRAVVGAQSLTLGHQAADWPPIPQILNLPALQSANAGADVVVQWNGFTSAGASDSISFTLTLGNEVIYSAPDPCIPIVLENTATSITLPKGLLVAGQSYDASLRYSHITYDTNSIPDIIGFAAVTKDLNFKIVTSGGTTGNSVQFSAPAISDGKFTCEITCSPGQTFTIESSPTMLPGSWQTLQTTNATGNKVQFIDSRPLVDRQYYRARNGS